MKKGVFTIGLIVVFSVFNLNSSYAQAPPTRYDSKDKDPDEIKFAVKTNVVSLISGEFPISFEYKFSKYVGVEAGAGLILPYHVNLELTNMVFKVDNANYEPFTNKKMGYSLLFSSNFYTIGRGWGNIFFNLFAHFRHYSTVNVLNCGLESGYRGYYFNALLFDFGLKVYWKHQNILEAGSAPYYSDAKFKIDGSFFIKIGYAF